jgi:hypothetical protein
MSASLRETCSALSLNVVSKNIILTDICVENRNNGVYYVACQCVEQFEGSGDACCQINNVFYMHLPPLLGKRIDFPGGYSSVDDRWGRF